ncbi:MAG: glutaminyl-peptide cyclotransferase [Candidatus Kapaibacterium sp.]
MRLSSIVFSSLLVTLIVVGCQNPDPGKHPPDTTAYTPPPPAPIDTTPVYTVEVVKEYPHDTAAFTEGLVYDDGYMLESTGMPGTSSLRETELASGRIVRKFDMPREYFGEGLAYFGDRLYQLTWQNQIGFVYDRKSFKQLDTFSFYGEGWGLTHDENNLIMSDGTSTLRILEPGTLKVKGTLVVFNGNQQVGKLNELEYIDGEIYANIWQTERIARIDPVSGNVKAWIDLTGILKPAERTGHEDVLNGIAYDPKGKRLFVTGKYWAKIYEIRLKPRAPVAAANGGAAGNGKS